MPYLNPDDRARIDAGEPARSPGELNYQLTRLVQRYIRENGDNYHARNDAVGALECCKLELYRRDVAPYEDAKIQANGDVYREAPASEVRFDPETLAELPKPFTTRQAADAWGTKDHHRTANWLRAHGFRAGARSPAGRPVERIWFPPLPPATEDR